MAGWAVAVDVGGTFTDLVAVAEGRPTIHLKVASTPADPAGGFLEALMAFRARVDGDGDRGGAIDVVLHGSTVVTNAIIEGRLARTALVTTAGFRDVLEIGRHWRTDLYDLAQARPATLVPRPLRLEVDERIDAAGEVVRPLEDGSLERMVAALDDLGVEAVAVALLHAYANPSHERRVRERLGDRVRYVTTSARTSNEPREYERSATTALNASLMPLVDGYLSRVEAAVGADGGGARLYVTHSNAGAMSPAAAREQPVSMAQSGPVAGVLATQRLARELGYPDVVALDMGGTSTDVALIEGGEPRLATQLSVGEIPIRMPAIQIHSVGAGGGSIASIDDGGRLRVGPRSAGADPGPAAYGRGGREPTVTDCNVVLGRIPEDWRLGGILAVDRRAAHDAVAEHLAAPLGIDVAAAAQGVIDIAVAAMEGAIRVLLRERGSDPRDFALVAFGGAGPLHAVQLAERLQIGDVLVPTHAGTFSAAGLAHSEIRHAYALSRPFRADQPDGADRLAAAYAELEANARAEFARSEGRARAPQIERRCDLRYPGQGHEVSVPLAAEPSDPRALERLTADFHDAHARAYGFADRQAPCEVRTVRLSVCDAPPGARPTPATDDRPATGLRERREVTFSGHAQDCAVLERRGLRRGERLPAPCVLLEDDATTLVPPAAAVSVADDGTLVISGSVPA